MTKMRSPFFQSAMPPLNSLGRVLGEVELVPESRLEPRTMSNECGEERQRDKRQERVLLEQNKTRETTHNKRNPNRQWNSTPVLSTKTRNRAATVCSVILCERHAPLLRRPAAEAENEHRWFTTPPALSAIAPAHTSESSIAAGKLWEPNEITSSGPPGNHRRRTCTPRRSGRSYHRRSEPSSQRRRPSSRRRGLQT